MIDITSLSPLMKVGECLYTWFSPHPSVTGDTVNVDSSTNDWSLRRILSFLY